MSIDYLFIEKYFGNVAIVLQVELFCVNNLINCSLESTEEFIYMEFRFTLRDNGMRAAFQLLHMVLEVNLKPDHNIIFENFITICRLIFKLSLAIFF